MACARSTRSPNGAADSETAAACDRDAGIAGEDALRALLGLDAAGGSA